MGAVAGFAAVDVGGFAYAGAWLRPGALTPPRFADRFEHVYGRHDGFRRNHAKGLSATGSFASTGAGAAICRAAVFKPGSVPVVGRFSLGGGLPDQADKPDTVRGLGLLFQAGGQQWRTAMINLPVFTDSTPQGFTSGCSRPNRCPKRAGPTPHDGRIPRSPSRDGRRDENHQAGTARRGIRGQHVLRSQRFWFTNDAGATVPVRWSVVPQDAGGPAVQRHRMAGPLLAQP